MSYTPSHNQLSGQIDESLLPESERLLYRLAQPQLAQEVLILMSENKTNFEPWMPLPPADYYTLPFQQAALAQNTAERNEGRQLKYYFALRKFPAKLIGEIGFNNIVMGAFCSCHVGYRIAQAHTNLGLMTEALMAATKHVFAHYGLHRAEANIVPRNKASVRVAEKAGFVNEGLSPKYVRINGRWEDHYHFVKRNHEME